MPTQEHDALVELFREDTDLAARLAGLMGVDLPDFDHTRLTSEDCTDLKTAGFRADSVILLEDADNVPRVGILIEVQRGRDDSKRFSWPAYLALSRARHQCPVVLLVITSDPKVAAWCSQPIDMGHPGLVLVPLVLPTDRIPVIIDKHDVATDPGMAILSAAYHASGRWRDEILAGFVAGLDVLAHKSPDKADRYTSALFAVLPQPIRKMLEDLMMTERRYVSDYMQSMWDEYNTRGRIEGEATSVLKVLAARGFRLTGELREKVLACTDAERLDELLVRAATITDLSQLPL